jgi:hypothetical protein
MKSRAAVSERVARAQGNLDAKVARAASLKEYTASASQISAADQEVREVRIISIHNFVCSCSFLFSICDRPKSFWLSNQSISALLLVA